MVHDVLQVHLGLMYHRQAQFLIALIRLQGFKVFLLCFLEALLVLLGDGACHYSFLFGKQGSGGQVFTSHGTGEKAYDVPLLLLGLSY